MRDLEEEACLRRRELTALIGTLYSGENEFQDSLAASLSQIGVEVDAVIFANMSKQRAHHALYSEFMRSRLEYPVRLKVDADMVIRERCLIRAISLTFQSFPALDRITVPVQDWFTGREIDGMHAFSQNVRWSMNHNPQLFTDGRANTIRYSAILNTEGLRLVDHACNPSLQQALGYGTHRILKALARGPTHSRWLALLPMVEMQNKEPDARRGSALGLIYSVISGQIGPESADDLLLLASDRGAQNDLRLGGIISAAEAAGRDPDLLFKLSHLLGEADQIRRITEAWSPPLVEMAAPPRFSHRLQQHWNRYRHWKQSTFRRFKAIPEEVVTAKFHEHLREARSQDASA